MDPDEFRHWGKVMVDYIADYWQTLRDRKPIPDVEPGYIRSLLPSDPPQQPESWEAIFKDLEKIVVAPNTHWMHPHFFAYYPAMNSYPSVMGDMLAGALSCVGFTWKASPSCTELELAVIDWLAKIIDLPPHFLNSNCGPAAGMIQGSASEATLTCLLSARSLVCRNSPDRVSETGSELFPRLVAYCSDQAHSSVERAALLGAVRMRKLPTKREDLFGLRGDTLDEAIKEDLKNGQIPFFTPPTPGMQQFVLNIAISLMGLRYKDARLVEQAFHVDPVYLRHEYGGVVPDMRMCKLAQDFGAMVESDPRFELFVPVTLALVCFRLKGSNEINEQLISVITKDRRIYLVASKIKDTYFLRFAVCSQFTTEKDIKFAWDIICEKSEEVSSKLQLL